VFPSVFDGGSHASVDPAAIRLPPHQRKVSRGDGDVAAMSSSSSPSYAGGGVGGALPHLALSPSHAAALDGGGGALSSPRLPSRSTPVQSTAPPHVDVVRTKFGGEFQFMAVAALPPPPM
jgi:hypothetical protein